MTGARDVVTAREAFARGEWRAALERYDVLRRHGTLGIEDLADAARAAWLVGDGDAAMADWETLYHELLRAGAPQRAAMVALQTGLEWIYRADLALGSAWVGRARRLLRHQPPCVARGYLLYGEAAMSLDVEGDPAPALAVAEEVDGLGQRFDDAGLASLARVLAGMAAVRAGRVDEGFDELEEAMLQVLVGRVDPLWAGDVYCTVIHLCEGLADLRRMRAWTDALHHWSDPISDTFVFAGVTRVHQLQLLAAEGDWAEVETQLGSQSEQLVGRDGWLAGTGFTELGDVRRLRGDLEGARESYSRARDQGTDPQPGEALLMAASGDLERALEVLRGSLGERGRLGRARLLLPAIRLALEFGERAAAEGLATELEASAHFYETPGLRARACQARALLHVADGTPSAATALLEQAAQAYRDQRFRYATAEVHEQLADVALALGDQDRAAASRATALAIYRRLGAAPDVARLERPGETAPPPGGLTPREAEVLACVVSGESNHAVAARLFISDKTVSRHLANIFRKIGVSSRTAAAAWAREHGLASRVQG